MQEINFALALSESGCECFMAFRTQTGAYRRHEEPFFYLHHSRAWLEPLTKDPSSACRLKEKGDAGLTAKTKGREAFERSRRVQSRKETCFPHGNNPGS